MAIFHIGDVVTVKSSVNGNYSNYGPNKGKEILFSPGMTGTIVSDKLPSVWRRGFSFVPELRFSYRDYQGFG